MAKQMGKFEAVIWIVGAIVVVSIVLYAVGLFDLVYNMIRQINNNPSAAP